jgi:hypothetical protein
MTKSTRFVLIGSFVVVVAVLATGLVAYYNGSLVIGSSNQPTEFAYVPAGSSAVAYADVRAIMNSQFRQRLRQVLPQGDEQARLKAEIGVDIEKDIDTVVGGLSGSDSAQGGLVMVRGRFDEAVIEAKAVEHGGKVETYKGKKLIVLGEHKEVKMAGEHLVNAEGSKDGCVAFLEKGLLGLGDVASVKQAIDAKASGRNVTDNAELMALVKDMRETGNAWAVGRFDSFNKSTDLPSAVKNQLGAVQLLAVSVRINGGVSGLVRAETRDDQSAEQLRDVIRGVLAAGRLMSGKDNRVDAVLNSFTLQGTGKTVSLTFTVPPEVFDILNGVAAFKGLNPGK